MRWWGRSRCPPAPIPSFSVGDILLVVSLLCLFIDLVMATGARTSSIVLHGLSMLVFVICLLEFLLVSGCGSSTFLIVTLMTLLGVVAGYSVTIVSARRSVAYTTD